jgi:hypothetical protein
VIAQTQVQILDSSGVLCLQESAEAYLVGYLKDTNLCKSEVTMNAEDSTAEGFVSSELVDNRCVKVQKL